MEVELRGSLFVCLFIINNNFSMKNIQCQQFKDKNVTERIKTFVMFSTHQVLFVLKEF